MNDKLKAIVPRHPMRSIGYTADYLTAFLPSIILTCIFLTNNILIGLITSLLTAFILETAYCIYTKKELDPTLGVRVVALCLCIPCETGIGFYALGGILIFVLGTARKYMDKYLSPMPVAIAILILTILMPRVLAPAHTVVNGTEFGKVAVWDLLMGYKSKFFGGGSIFALAFAFVYLSVRKRINPLSGLLFYFSLIAVLAFLYKDGELNAIYYVTFIALDARIFFGSLILLNMGALPFEKKAAYIISILGGAFLGYLTLNFGAADGIYYVIALISLIARPIDVVICKLKNPKKAEKI